MPVHADGQPPDEPGGEGPPSPPGLFLRLLVVGFGLVLLATAGALVRTATVVGVVLGVLTGLAGVTIVAIASGVVEWVVARRRR